MRNKKLSIIMILILLLTTIGLGCTENTPSPGNKTNNQENETNGEENQDFLEIEEYNVTEGDYFKFRAMERKSDTIKNGRFTVWITNVTNSTYEIHYMGYGELFNMDGPEVKHKNISDPVFREDIIERGIFNGKQEITINNDTITLDRYIMEIETSEGKSVTRAFFHPAVKVPVIYRVENSKGKITNVELTETNLEALNQTLN